MNHIPVWRMFGPISFVLLDLILCLLLMATPMRFRRLLQMRILFGLSYGLTLAILDKTEIAGVQLPLSLILAGFLGRPGMVRGCVFFIFLFVYALVSISISVHRYGY